MRRATAFAATCLLAAACRGGSRTEEGAAPTTSAAPPPPAASALAAPPPKTRPLCRVTTLVGAAKLAPGPAAPDGAPLAASVDVPSGAWVDVAAGGRLSVRDARTGREFHFVGPARARPCVGEEDESWMARGIFESTRGTGEAPGTEQWVVTSFGVVRYATGAVRIEVTMGGLTARIDGGVGFVWPLPGVRIDSRHQTFDGGAPPPPPPPAASVRPAKPRPAVTGDGWTRFEAGVAMTLRYDDTRNDLARARFAADSCTAVAREARRLARLLAEPDSGIGDLAPRHVDARRKARAACAVASLRAELLPPSETREGLLGSLRAAGSEWRALGL